MNGTMLERVVNNKNRLMKEKFPFTDKHYNTANETTNF